MKVVVIGSRSITEADLEPYIPADTEMIISGGAKGVDALARMYAEKKRIPYMEVRPDYQRYNGKKAPLIRNREIVDRADLVVALWDGVSGGTAYTIQYTKKVGKRLLLVQINDDFTQYKKAEYR